MTGFDHAVAEGVQQRQRGAHVGVDFPQVLVQRVLEKGADRRESRVVDQQADRQVLRRGVIRAAESCWARSSDRLRTWTP